MTRKLNAKLNAGLSGLCLILLSSIIGSGSAFAHHSFAMYDTRISMNFTGKLMRFIPGANHAQILFEVIDENGELTYDDDGNVMVWGIETSSSSRIAREGVTVAAFPVGTIINVGVNPLRNGKTFGLQNGAIIHCGTELPANGCNADTGKAYMTPRPRVAP